MDEDNGEGGDESKCIEQRDGVGVFEDVLEVDGEGFAGVENVAEGPEFGSECGGERDGGDAAWQW